MFKYMFDVPDKKKYRVIIHTDCKNEADDQYALAHALMTPKFMVRGIIAGHFDAYPQESGHGQTAKASYDEVMKVLDLMDLKDFYKDKVYMGAPCAMTDGITAIDSPGARFLIEEAVREDDHPLFALFQGAITDLACAILMCPKICERMTAVWIGGGMYPDGGDEFNLWNDISAANVVFKSRMPLWQIPVNVYKQMAVSLAELQYRVQLRGKIGDYLFRQMVAYNNKMGNENIWPHGETWGLGDQAVIAVLMEELEKVSYRMLPAPLVDEDMHYIHGQNNREIRVYESVDARYVMEDFYAKLAINYR